MKIIALAPNDWTGPWMNRQQILSRLGRKHTVVFSNGCASVWELRNHSRTFGGLLGRYTWTDSVYVELPSKLLLKWPRFARLSRFVSLAWQRRILAFTNSLSEQDSSTVVYIFHPLLYNDASSIDCDLLVYHAYDLFSSTPGWTEQHAEMERRLVAASDVIFASSETIAADLRLKCEKDVIFLPNGVDEDTFFESHFTPLQPHELMSRIPPPRVGYAGNINRKVDLELVLQLAQSMRNVSFVMVGGVANLDAHTSAALECCRQEPNIFFVGHQDHTLLPDLMASMNVNIMCYRLSEDLWTEGIYPLKLHEYLAVGRPVVSAAVPSVLEFSDTVTIASGVEQWSASIKHALLDQSKADFGKRRKVAASNTWASRVRTIDSVLEDALKDNK